jgi:hypothetical protein
MIVALPSAQKFLLTGITWPEQEAELSLYFGFQSYKPFSATLDLRMMFDF